MHGQLVWTNTSSEILDEVGIVSKIGSQSVSLNQVAPSFVSLLDFAKNIPINDGQLHKASDYYPSIDLFKEGFPNSPIDLVSVKLNGWENISIAWCAAWEASVSEYTTLFVPDGRYIFNAPIILRKERQKWICNTDERQTTETSVKTCVFEWIGDGSPFKHVITRRLYRGNANDPTDAPLSACVQIENKYIKFQPIVSIEHNKQWAEEHQNDLVGGDPNYDVGIFIGCRLFIDLTSGGSVGHFRFANLYADVTRSGLLSELTAWDGVRNPVTPESGIDGLCLDRGSYVGGRWRIVQLGAKFKDGLNSYGFDYKDYLDILFNSIPQQGDTLTIGEAVFYFGEDAPFGTFGVVIGTDIQTTINNLIDVAVAVSEDAESNKSVFNSADFINSSINTLTCVRNSRGSSQFVNLRVYTTTTRISIPSSFPLSRPDPAPYYDDLLGAMTDSRGGYGASDVTGYRVLTLESEHFKGRRIWEDIRLDKDHTKEGISAGSMWLDVAAANSRRRGWGQRYISCRFASYEPFIVRLERIARVTFMDCHTEPAERAIYDTSGAITTERYGSYTNTKESFSINLCGANAAPNAAYFAVRDAGTNITRPNSGINVFGGSMKVTDSLTVGTGSLLEKQPNFYVYGSASQEIFYGNETQKKAASIRYTVSDGRMTFYTGGTATDARSIAFRMRYSSQFNLSTLDCLGGMKITALTSVDIEAATGVVIKGQDGKIQYYNNGNTPVTIFSWDSANLRLHGAIRPDSTSSTTQTIGTSAARFSKAWINDVRMLPPSSVTLTGSGEMAFETLSNTSVRLKLRGTDGVVRSVTLALA